MNDPYVYENGVLVNKKGITNSDELSQFEADICFVKLMSIDSIEINKFDENLVKRIHKYIFEDIYDWAGEYRTVPLIKEEVVLPGYTIPYSNYKNIGKDLNIKLKELNAIKWNNMDDKELFYSFARKMALIWRIHPFRDGNTRTMLSFAFLFAKKHSFPFDMATFANELSRKYDNYGNPYYNIRDRFVVASLDDEFKPEIDPLASVFERAKNKENSNRIHHK